MSEVAANSWPTIRKRVLERDDHECRFCDAQEDSTELEIHHIVPRKYGGGDDLDNLITVCESCHLEVQSVSNQIVEWVQAKSSSDDMELESEESPGYVIERETVKEDRNNRVVALLRDEYSQLEDEIHQEVADEMGMSKSEVSILDIREAMYYVAAEHIDELADILLDWGYEHRK